MPEKRSETENILDPGYLDHPLEVWGVDSVLDEPAGELVPLIGVATVDGQTRLRILILGILQVTGYFLVYTNVKTGLDRIKFDVTDPFGIYRPF